MSFDLPCGQYVPGQAPTPPATPGFPDPGTTLPPTAPTVEPPPTLPPTAPTIEPGNPPIPNNPPFIDIILPSTTITISQGQPTNFVGVANDIEDGDLTANIIWKSNLVPGNLGVGGNITYVLPLGVNIVRASITDSGGLIERDTVIVNVVAASPGVPGTIGIFSPPINNPPDVIIESPSPGMTFPFGSLINLVGKATDPEQGIISNFITWESDKDGFLGQGASIQVTLSINIHTITARIIDNAGSMDTAFIILTIEDVLTSPGVPTTIINGVPGNPPKPPLQPGQFGTSLPPDVSHKVIDIFNEIIDNINLNDTIQSLNIQNVTNKEYVSTNPYGANTNLFFFKNRKDSLFFLTPDSKIHELPNKVLKDDIGIEVRTDSFVIDPTNQGNVEAIKRGLYYDTSSNIVGNFIPVPPELIPNYRYLTIFNTTIDKTLSRIFSEIASSSFDSNSLSNLSLDKIELSLRPEILNKFNYLTTVLGRSINRECFIYSLFKLIKQQSIENFTEDQLNNLIRQTMKDSVSMQFYRTASLSLPEIISYGLVKKCSLDPRRYDNIPQKNFMKNWWVRPTEIHEKILVTTSAGMVQLNVSDSSTIDVVTSAGTTRIDIADDRFIPVTSPDGYITKCYTTHNLSSSYTLRNFDKLIILNWLNQRDTVEIFFEALDPDIEFNYSLSTAPSAYYLLQLDRDSITDYIDYDIIKHTKARYTQVTDVESFNTYVRRKGAPWLICYISNNDPVTGYLDALETTITAKFKDITLNNVGATSSTINLISRLPAYIFIIPTNRFEFNPFSIHSELLESKTIVEVSSNYFTIDLNTDKFNRRKLTLENNLRKDFYNVGFTTPLTTVYKVAKGENEYGEMVDTQTFTFALSSTPIAATDTQSYINKPTTRVKSGIRAYYEELVDLSASGNISPAEVMSRMSSGDYYALQGINIHILNNLARLFNSQLVQAPTLG